jgi:hypothetical protein
MIALAFKTGLIMGAMIGSFAGTCLYAFLSEIIDRVSAWRKQRPRTNVWKPEIIEEDNSKDIPKFIRAGAERLAALTEGKTLMGKPLSEYEEIIKSEKDHLHGAMPPPGAEILEAQVSYPKPFIPLRRFPKGHEKAGQFMPRKA